MLVEFSHRFVGEGPGGARAATVVKEERLVGDLTELEGDGKGEPVSEDALYHVLA
jgi:hypothetical protein